MPCSGTTWIFAPARAPSQNATLCTYSRWFSRPLGLRHPSLLQLPISACCMRVLLRFRLGCHSLPIVSGRRSGVPRHQRLCLHCASNVVGDERHMVFDCTALLPVRGLYPGLFGPTIVTMQQSMWQRDLVGVAHFVLDCFRKLHSPGWWPIGFALPSNVTMSLCHRNCFMDCWSWLHPTFHVVRGVMQAELAYIFVFGEQLL